MTSPVSTNNRRIAKNTLLLYFRMLLMIGINLYTSRVILQVLGVEDFGINNVVGGVITMLGFLTGSLAGASSRYITYDLGKGDMEIMKKTFGNILSIHLLLAGLVVVIGETIGLWFMTTQLQIPETRETAAFWVYQFSIISFVLSVISVPYNASIIAHEKMSAFAYISIVDAVLKLLIVYLLLVIPYDKLIVYAALFCCIQIFDRIVYSIYCRKHFEETRSKLSFDKKLFKEIFTFAGWTMNGSLAVIGYTQGINVLLNIFFGPAVNAARGIAVQVQNVTRQFCTNFQMALNPQLTKSYATGDYAHMHRLLKVSSKFSFYLMLLISLPLMLEAPLILKWWLGAVPEHTVNFLRLILCTGILFALSNPIITAVHATGKLKKFQLIEGSMLLSIVPVAYLLLRFFRIPPEHVFLVHILVEICTQYVRIRIVLPLIVMPLREYIADVIKPVLKVGILALIIPMLVYCNMNVNIASFLVVCLITACWILLVIYFIGCTKNEQFFVKGKFVAVLDKLKNNFLSVL
ncbi:lipopolysaccharide biosynthesis protein [Paraprevotella xylaniphila]|uniref:lipopolysaccharide biosynthesis protein n=1 Tax=Paraprevotella xylaniphila TaxID=454155 RepID=UPI00266CBEC1|nr:lipopolysaccharide biosynthesis protein [Paraprevotella xylaniphila]